VSIDLIC